MDNVNTLVIGKLKRWKDENNVTNRYIAKNLGITDALVGQYLNAKKQLPNTRFLQVAELMNISMDELLSDGNKPYKVHLRGKISNFAGELGLDRVIARIELQHLK